MTVKDGNERLLLICRKLQCSFIEILAALGLSNSDVIPPSPESLAQRKSDQVQLAARKAAQARAIWEEALPIKGTVVETYLRNRHISGDMPASLRFHPKCWHGPSARKLPAMVAKIVCLNGGSDPAIHRTYLRPDGMAKADVSPAKMMLGAAKGGGVVLSAATGPLVVAEGIETALSLMSGLLEGPASVIAALSTSGMRSLNLPPRPPGGALIVATDGEVAGREAGAKLAGRAHALGWRASIIAAPDGQDFNNVLMQGKAG